MTDRRARLKRVTMGLPALFPCAIDQASGMTHEAMGPSVRTCFSSFAFCASTIPATIRMPRARAVFIRQETSAHHNAYGKTTLLSCEGMAKILDGKWVRDEIL